MHQSIAYIRDHAETLQSEAVAGDEQAVITQKTADILAESGGMKLLLAEDLGGYEVHPLDFMDWAIEVGQNQPSAGWIGGVVGVHPWEISLMDPKLQQEIYGNGKSDTWTASPYAPQGRAKKVDGGVLLTGHWQFSTGTDFCDWVILGGFMVDDDGKVGTPPDMRHFVLPRSDYEIVPDSWNVLGLKGTGSKDVRMTDAFVPDYRVVDATKMSDGTFADERRPDQPLYQMGFGVMFPAAIAAGTFGIARGALRAFEESISTRKSTLGVVSKTDPFQLRAFAIAESDVEASIAHFRQLVGDLFDYVSKGGKLTPDQKLRFRRDQVRATNRAITALDELFNNSGSSMINEGHPVARFRRDLHTSRTHICNVPEQVYQNWGMYHFNDQLPAIPL